MPDHLNRVEYRALLAEQMWDYSEDRHCRYCANGGVMRILKYDFDKNKYLMLRYVNGVDENGRNLLQQIDNHPESVFQLQGKTPTECSAA